MSEKNHGADDAELSVDPEAVAGDDFAAEEAVLADAAEVVDSAPVEPIKRTTAPAPVKKSKPTPKRGDKHHDPSEDDKRVGPVTFTKQSVGELKQVNWPTGAQMRQYFVAVLIFVLFIITYVGLLDLGFGTALLKLLG